MFALDSTLRLTPVRLRQALGLVTAATILIGCATQPVPSGMDMTPTLPANLRAIIVYAPAPEFPAAARAKRVDGSGIVLIIIDKGTGRVTSATMQEGTGESILDRAAVDAFREWRFKPGTISRAKIPITFKYRR